MQSEVTSRFFDVLGVTAEVGRTLLEGEDLPGRDRVAVLGHALWQQRFGGDRSVIGRSVIVDGIARTVVGVMPAASAFRRRQSTSGYRCRSTRRRRTSVRYWGTSHLNVIGRLRRGVSVSAGASRRSPCSWTGAAASFPWRMPDAWGTGVTVVPLERKVDG